MSPVDVPQAEEIILYEKDPSTRIATITINRPDQLNVPTIGARRRYADLLFKASIDDDVKVLVVRGVGDHLGTGADLDELMAKREAGTALHEEFGIDEDEDITMPGPRSYRAGAPLLHWYGNTRSGCRTLQDFKKIRILEVKGYVYGWHFYLAGDADMVIASEEALFGHAAFRYVGWGPRMWNWADMMGVRKFMEMVFTGRPFTAQQMYECNFVNSVVPREDLEAETAARPRLFPDASDRHCLHAEGVLRGDEAAPGRVHGHPADAPGSNRWAASFGRMTTAAGDPQQGDDGRRAQPGGQGQRRRVSSRVAAEPLRSSAPRNPLRWWQRRRTRRPARRRRRRRRSTGSGWPISRPGSAAPTAASSWPTAGRRSSRSRRRGRPAAAMVGVGWPRSPRKKTVRCSISSARRSTVSSSTRGRGTCRRSSTPCWRRSMRWSGLPALR